MSVATTATRSTIEDFDDHLVITLPSRKHWPVILISSVWQVFWLFGELVVIASLLLGKIDAWLFALIWLAVWTVAGGFTAYALLWNLSGCETIEVDAYGIRIQRQVLKFNLARSYFAQHIADVHVSPYVYNLFSPSWSVAYLNWGVGGGSIAFDYGGRQIRMGNGADDMETRHIVAAIHKHFPQYGSEYEFS